MEIVASAFAKRYAICHKSRTMDHDWGVYVHVPWCRRRCPYCDFFFEVGKPEQTFASKIAAEFDERRAEFPNSKPATLYFGGGTPSLMPIDQLEKIIHRVPLREGAEITLEANPEDVTGSLVKSWLKAGINRLSLGIQSFDDAILKQLGRKHRSIQAWESVQNCLDQGLLRLSVDLIFGVPGEDSEAIAQSVERLSTLGVGHISAYLLTVEPGTNLEKHIKTGRAKATDDDEQAKSFEDMQKIMHCNGFTQYEISSYSKPGQESRHNRNYWGKGAYLGLGPSAHSMRLCQDGSVERSKNPSILMGWGDNREIEILSKEEALLESIAFGLRDLSYGISLESLEARHRTPIPKGVFKALQKSEGHGWLIRRAERYYLTSLGVRFADGVAREILSAD